MLPAFEEQPLGFSLEWENFQDSAILGNSLIEKYGRTRNCEVPDRIQRIIKERRKPWTSKK